MIVVGLTVDLEAAAKGRPADNYVLRVPYVKWVQRAGALAFMLPYVSDRAHVEAYLDRLDALVVTGGYFDVPAELYGERSGARMGTIKQSRTDFELALIRGAIDVRMPILGVCGGMQLLNVAYGGTLHQDILEEIAGAKEHEQGVDPRKTFHAVDVLEGSRLAACLGGSSNIEVNSTHHQAVKRPGEGLIVSGRSPDGVIEGIEDPSRPFLLGVQWHPELLADEHPAQQSICGALVEAALAAKTHR